MTDREAINNLEMCRDLMLFDPMHGEAITYDSLNAENKRLHDACGVAITAIRERTERRWVSVEERLPKVETEVFALTVDGVVTTAIYEDGKMPTNDSLWWWDEDMNFEYDAERDVYLIPEGWWENCHFNQDDRYNNVIDRRITHWMPLPKLPKMEKGARG